MRAILLIRHARDKWLAAPAATPLYMLRALLRLNLARGRTVMMILVRGHERLAAPAAFALFVRGRAVAHGVIVHDCAALLPRDARLTRRAPLLLWRIGRERPPAIRARLIPWRGVVHS